MTAPMAHVRQVPNSAAFFQGLRPSSHKQQAIGPVAPRRARPLLHLLRVLAAFAALVLGSGLASAQCMVTNVAMSQSATTGVNFGPYTATVRAQSLSNMAVQSTTQEINYFDIHGKAHNGKKPGFWKGAGGNSGMVLVFTPGIPANWIIFEVIDVGVTSGTDSAYNPTITFSFSPSTITAADFRWSNYPGLNGAGQTMNYNSSTGVVTRSDPTRVPGSFGSLVGNSDKLVTELRMSTNGIINTDAVSFVLGAIPSCISVSTISQGGTGDFAYGYTNLSNPGAVALSSETLTTTSGAAVTSSKHYARRIDGSVELTETPPAGFVLASASCTDAQSTLNDNPSTALPVAVAGNTVTIPADNVRDESDITCTFINQKQPILRLSKTLNNGRSTATDQFALNIAGAGGPASATTTGTGSTATGTAMLNAGTAGSVYALSESGSGSTSLSSYNSTFKCTNALAGGQSTSGTGTSFNITAAPGDDLSCVFTNSTGADLSVAKSANPAAVRAGDLVTYSLAISNAGGGSANGAVLRDTPSAGVDCAASELTAPTCTASGGATCPSAETLTNATLVSSGGLAIPTLPAGGSVVISMQCKVTATGQP